jgi:hypothetical protein
MIDFIIYSFLNIKLFIPNVSELIAFFGLLQFLTISLIIGIKINPKSNFLSISFFTGYGFIYFVTVFFYVFFSIEVNKIYYLIIIGCIFILIKNKELYLLKLNNIIFIIAENKIILFTLLPLILILFNSKALGWDVFSHWLPLANALNLSSEFLLRGHATNYPFASSIVLVFSSIYNSNIQENISALFSILQLIFILEIIFFVIKKNFLIKNNLFVKSILVLIIFFNPLHMNKFIYTSYVDFDSSVAIFYFVFLLYLLKLNPQQKETLLQLSLIGCLVVGLKNTGIILIFFSLLSFVIILSYENLIPNIKKYFIPLLILSTLILSCWITWQYLLFNNNMMEKFIVYDYLRKDLIKPFFNSIIFQINERKLFYFFSFFVIFSNFFKKKIFNSDKQINFFISIYSIFFVFWTLFVILTYIFHFNSGILDNATSFWRYNFQTSIILLFIFCYMFFFFLERIKFLNFEKVTNIIILFIIFLPIVFMYKFRRDLEPKYLTINEFQNFKNKINSALVISEDSAYNAMRLNYYLNNDYRKSIVDSIEISNLDKSNNSLYLENKNNYDLVILLDQSDLLNFKKKIYYKK